MEQEQAKETATAQAPIQLVLSECAASALVVSLIDEALLILAQKRATLEEKAIAGYFRRLVCAYSVILGQFHTGMSHAAPIGDTTVSLAYRLRTVNENLRSRVEELLKILKYDWNYLEQYFEYDYCGRLLNSPELHDELEAIGAELLRWAA